MAKLTTTDISADYGATTTINNNFDLIETAIENTLSRDGTSPNAMAADFDMGSNNINNVKDAISNQQVPSYKQVLTKQYGDGGIPDGYFIQAASKAAALTALATVTSLDAGKKVFITSNDGGEFTVKYNATPGTYADNGGDYCGTVFIPTGGDGTIGLVRSYAGALHAAWFGFDSSNSGTVNTTAMQAAIDLLESDSKGGRINLPKGNFDMGSTVYIRKNGIRLYGQGPAATNIIPEVGFTSGTPIFRIAAAVAGDPIGYAKVTEMKFNDTNSTGARGIEFAYLAYDSEFSHLDFDGFTSSCIYTTDRAQLKISEQLLFLNIKTYPGTKTITEPPFDLFRVNESLMTQCKLFGKQYAATPYSSVEMLKIDQPQQFNIFSNSFANTNEAAIRIHVSNNAQAQYFSIKDNHFEDIDGAITIDVQGYSSGQRGNYGLIDQNRYLEIPNPVINIDNWTGLIIREHVPGIVLNSGTLLCTAETLVSGLAGVTNTGANNIVLEMDSDVLKYRGADAGQGYIQLQPKDAIVDYGVNTGANKIRTYADYQSAALQRFRFLYDGTTDMGGFTNSGVYSVVKTTAGAPASTTAPEGTMIPNSADSKLYVRIGGAWKSVTLV